MLDPNLISLGKRIRRRRGEISLSQSDLGALSDIDRTYISGIERGRRNPTYLLLRRLSLALDMTMESLCKED